jgi:hypothetical protein
VAGARRGGRITPPSPNERVRRTSSGEPSGGNRCIGGNQVRKDSGNLYLDMEVAIESEVAELHSSTATGAPL